MSGREKFFGFRNEVEYEKSEKHDRARVRKVVSVDAMMVGQKLIQNIHHRDCVGVLGVPRSEVRGHLPKLSRSKVEQGEPMATEQPRRFFSNSLDVELGQILH